MAIFSSRLLRHEFCVEELRKIGAEVIDMEGIMFFVKYHQHPLHIEYIYHLHTNKTYLLERIKPYPLVIGEYKVEENVIETIKTDIDQFMNAVHSKNFNAFVGIDQDLTKIMRSFEDLYLYYNISKEDIALLKTDVEKLAHEIFSIKNRSKRVYYKTEPASFKE
ncbi:hypothetical protein QBE52_07205 [Clostridiaceae bacterium 35-E11]